jgi:hypothetical protein
MGETTSRGADKESIASGTRMYELHRDTPPLESAGSNLTLHIR